MTAVIVFGPQGCGKTLQVRELLAHFRCSQVVDEWLPGDPVQPGTLYLTCENVGAVRGARVVPWASLVELGVVRNLRAPLPRRIH